MPMGMFFGLYFWRLEVRSRYLALGLSIIVMIALAPPSVARGQQSSRAATDQPDPSLQQIADRCITPSTIRAHVRFLADDLLEGRGPGTRGDELAQRYIAAQFESLGLEPAASAGSWYQKVPLVGLTTQAPANVTFNSGSESLTLKRHDDYIVNNARPSDEVSLNDIELVFVGYGMQAPEFDWDDFKGVDVSGKILLFMNNDPSDDPQLFAGRRRLYYGRWDYKYAMAARQGAVGALILHTTPSAGYPYQVVQTSWTGEQLNLRGEQSDRLTMEGWLTEDAARQVVELAGKDLDDLRAAAERRDFRPVPLDTTMSISMKCRVRNRDTANVLGLLKGRDPELSREMVVFMAHHDHIGLATARDERGDNIYNGAVDNASGVGVLLAIAKACAALPEEERPRRSLLFAAVGAEEQGLLGSEFMAQHPPVPPGFLAVVLNIDGINILGPTRDVVVVGYGKSDMDRIVERVAKWQKREVTPDQFPDLGYYYRSDQFSLAKIGVPGVYLNSGIHVIGKPAGWGKQQLEQWIDTKYHQTSDEFSDDWDLRGAVLDAQLLFHTGLQAANQLPLPAWNPGDEFEAARKAALEARNP